MLPKEKNNMATFKAVIFHGGRHLKKDGTTNIKVRIYHNGSAQYIPTEYFIEPDFMNADGTISSLSGDNENLNYEITGLIQKYRGAYIRLGNSRTTRTVSYTHLLFYQHSLYFCLLFSLMIMASIIIYICQWQYKTTRMISRMIEGIRYADFSLSFSTQHKTRTEQRLAQEINNVVAEFRTRLSEKMCIRDRFSTIL